MAPLPQGLIAEADAGPEISPLWLLREADVAAAKANWPPAAARWLESIDFTAKPGATAVMPDEHGGLFGAVSVIADPASPFDAAGGLATLPNRTFRLAAESAAAVDTVALGWALQRYRYKRPAGEDRSTKGPRLVVDTAAPAIVRAVRLACAMHLARDLVNMPANQLGPVELGERVTAVAKAHGAELETTVGDALLAANYPAIHAVGRASASAPRLLDLRWGDASAPKLTLVGKGVCFDTGGLDIKPSANMLLMKKDMGGAAVMLALADAVMAAGMKVRLRLLIPAVENSIAGNAFRPGDVIATRKGLSVEIGNTDAEGRLILADALAEADQEVPDLLIDAATLTGAARVALGADLPALFTPDDGLAQAFAEAGGEMREPLWRLPLFEGYRRSLDSATADLSNTGSSRFGGAITAALFLQAFVAATPRWAHLDIFCHNPKAAPGRPAGGEATALLALYRLLERRYGS